MPGPANNYSFPALTGAIGLPSGLCAPMGRISLASATPVMMASVTGGTSVYLTPRSILPVWNAALGGFYWQDTGAELSQATTDSTKSPAAVGASSTYDTFFWIDTDGTPRHTRGPAWTNGTTRACALKMLNGVYVNAVSITNGPTAYQGTYTGTVQSNASSTIDWTLGTAASGGGAAVLNCWNMYNRKLVATRVTDNGVTYTYSTATVRQARGAVGNQISYVAGLAEDCITAAYQQTITTVGAVGAYTQIGVGDDSITAFETVPGQVYTNVAVALTGTGVCLYQKGMGEPMIGPHYVAALEKGDGTNANTLNVGTQGELSFTFMM